MISFSTLPMGCSFSANPIEYVGTTNQQFVLPNIYPSLQIGWLNKLENGARFWFNIIDPITQNSVTIQFTCVENPTEYAELPDLTFIGSVAEYVSACMQIIANHPMIAANYNVIRLDDFNIKLIAKEAIEELVPTDLDKTSGYVDGVLSTVFFQSSKRLGFRIIAHVYFEDEYLSNVFEKVAELDDTPDSNSKFTFDIQSVIHSCIENSFELPLLPAMPNLVQKSTAIRRFFVKFREEWTGADNQWIDTEILTSHYGGVKMADWLRQNPFAYLLSTDQFLTWYPNGKRLRESQLDWLSYMNTCGENQKVDAKLDVYFTDGTSVTNVMIGSADLAPWETMIIAAGYTQLSLNGIALLKKVYKWVIRAVGDVSASVSQTFYFAPEDYISSHCLVYINSFGVPESFLTIGRWIESFQTTKSFANKTIVHAHKFVNGQEFSFNHNSTEFHKAVSGYLTKPEALALKDFLQDAPVFLVENSELIPVLIESGSLNLTNESENLSQIEFEVRKSYKLKQVSEQKTMPKLTPIIKCGISGIEFEPNGLVPADLTACSINVYYEGELVGTVAYADWAEFPTVITNEGTFIFELIIELADGSTQTVKTLYEYTMPIVEIHWEQEGAGDNSFQIAQSEWKKLFIHWGDGTESLFLPTGTGVQTILHNYPSKLSKTILKMPCFDHVTRFNIITQNCVAWDISKFTALERLALQEIGTKPNISFVGLNKLQSIKVIKMNVETVEFGFMPDIDSIDFSDCQFNEAAIESILLQIWNQRKMIVASVNITLTGNPGASSITAISDDIINGTGAYSGQGLVSDYGYTITL